MEELNEKQRKEKVQTAIRDYINEHKKNNTYIKSKSQIFQDLGKKTYGISQATFYRYMEEMHCKPRANGRYDFSEDESEYLTSFLDRRYYNSTIYFHINEPFLGSYISSKLNEYYKPHKKAFYCVALQDLLICFYRKKGTKKNGKPNGGLTLEKIKNDINLCLQQYMLLYKANEDN